MAAFPVISPISKGYLRILSIIQIVLGVLFVFAFITDIVLNVHGHFNCKQEDPNPDSFYGYSYCKVIMVDSMVTSTGIPIWAGLLVVLTGCLGLGSVMAKVKARRIGMRNGFQMMSVLSTIILAPALFLLVAIDMKMIQQRYFGQYRSDYRDSVIEVADKKKGLLGVIILMCIVEFAIAGISSTVSCICPVNVDDDDSDETTLIA